MKKELELKDNLCAISFHCIEEPGNTECVHHKNIPKKCKYLRKTQYGYYCDNSIAQVQAVTKHLKHIGLDISGDGFNAGIYKDIKNEVNRAKTLHENKNYAPVDWLAVLGEEVGEVNSEVNAMREKCEPLSDNYVTELIQIAAVCVRMIEDYRKSSDC